MTILETALLFTAILVSVGSVFFLRSSIQKNQNAGLKLIDADQKYRQARESRNSAEDALRRAEDEQLDAKRKLEQAHEALSTAELIRLQANDEIRIANDARIKAEQERDISKDEMRQAKEDREAVIHSKEQAKHERDAANERAQLAERVITRIGEERDTATRERNDAIEEAHLVNERAEHWGELLKHAEFARDTAIRERDAAIEQARLAKEHADRAEESRKQAEENLRFAIQDKSSAEERVRHFENEARLANEHANKMNREYDDAIERARLAEQAQKRAEDARDAVILAKADAESKRDEVIKHAEKVERECDVAIRRAEQAEKEHRQAIKVLERAKKRRRNWISPAERKGKRSRYKQPSIQFAPRLPKPEIVCRDRNLEWELAVELPDDLLTDTEEPQVHQENSLLEQEHDLWQLKDLRNRITVRSGEKSWEIRLDERENNYLLFKLSGYDLRHGTRVCSINRGAYLIVVPEVWDRADSNLGSKPEAVSIEGYLAYYYVVDQPCKIAFRTPDGENIEITQSATQFDLIGNRLPDADEEGSPLFGDLLPRIRATDPTVWEKVKTIVVGEEGRERTGWKSTLITPIANQAEQELPTEILDWQAPWLFLRFYDEDDQLIESADFRLARGLSKIQVSQASPFPGGDGHSAASVEFYHATDCIVKSASGIDFATDGNMTLAEIPKYIAFDKTDWKFGVEGPDQIDVAILVERIWWAVGTKEKTPLDSEWVDTLLALTRADFAANSNKVLWIRFPKPRWTNEVHVGFSQESARPIPVKVTEQTVSIPLCDFCDSMSLRQIGVSQFGVRVDDFNGPLAEISVQAKCHLCNALELTEEGIREHIEKQHIHECFRPLEYDELRKQIPSLPPVIFECIYCGKYVTDEPENSTTLFYHIIRRKCPKIPPGLERPPVQQRRVIDINEIREKIYNDLPDIRKCKFCGEQIEWHTSQQAMRHLLEKHNSRLYELR